jgi:hypothetical protein
MSPFRFRGRCSGPHGTGAIDDAPRWLTFLVALAPALALVAFLAACAVPLEQQAVTVAGDQFSQVATFSGTKLFDNPFGGVFKEWFIRSFVDKRTGGVSHQLYIHTSYTPFLGGSWHFYESGADDTARSLPFVQIDRTVESCSGTTCTYDETFALTLEDSVLRARAATGFAIKVSAHDGASFILQVPPGQIQPQLAAIDDYLRAHQLSSASPSAVVPTPPSQPSPVTPGTTTLGNRTLGVKGVPTPSLMAPLLGVPSGKGMWVVSIDVDSMAESAGIKQGDVILSINGTEVNDPNALLRAIAAAPSGQPIPIVLWSAKVQRQVSVRFWETSNQIGLASA